MGAIAVGVDGTRGNVMTERWIEMGVDASVMRALVVQPAPNGDAEAPGVLVSPLVKEGVSLPEL